MGNLGEASRNLSSPVSFVLVLFIGIALRWFALCHIYIINPDGILYINQAKLIASGNWNAALDGVLSYISIYPLLISAVHFFLPDWILSGQIVALVFGCGVLVSLYALLRFFFSSAIAQLTVLLYAVTPLLVRYSVDVMRDSTYWFFYISAVALFVWSNKFYGMKYILCIMLTFFCVFLAIWARVEAMVLLPSFLLYLLVSRKSVRFYTIALLTVFIVSYFLFVDGEIFTKYVHVFRINEVIDKFSEPMSAYTQVRNQLYSLSTNFEYSLLGRFFEEAYHSLWFIPLIVIVNNTCEAFFYPYILFYLIGAVKVHHICGDKQKIIIFYILIFFGFLVLYAHVVQLWFMTYRFVALLLLPSAIFAAGGIAVCVQLFEQKLGHRLAVVVLVICIVLPSLSKNLGPIEKSKYVYPEIAYRATELASDLVPVTIAGLDTTAHKWVSFYASAQEDTPLIFSQMVVAPSSIQDLADTMRLKNIPFVLWEKHAWAKLSFAQSPTAFGGEFEEAGTWDYNGKKTLILYRLKERVHSLPLEG